MGIDGFKIYNYTKNYKEEKGGIKKKKGV